MSKNSDLNSLKNRAIDDFECFLDAYMNGEMKYDQLEGIVDKICLITKYDNFDNSNFITAKLMR